MGEISKEVHELVDSLNHMLQDKVKQGADLLVYNKLYLRTFSTHVETHVQLVEAQGEKLILQLRVGAQDDFNKQLYSAILEWSIYSRTCRVLDVNMQDSIHLSFKELNTYYHSKVRETLLSTEGIINNK